MKKLFVLLALAANPVFAKEPPVAYLPIVYMYVGDDFVGAKMYEPQKTFKECMEFLSRQEIAVLNNAVVAGSTVNGGCAPVPPVVHNELR